MQTLKPQPAPTSNFEAHPRDIVITNPAKYKAMESNNTVPNIEDKSRLDPATAQQLARIIEFLTNIED